jgi:hypothetical protein
MKVGDLVKSRFTDPASEWKRTIGTIIEMDEMGSVPGAWVEWFNKGLYWSPTHQLEIISEAG